MLWGAFTNASQAMQSMDWAMGSISQNIANVNTAGYKRKETEFKTLLSEGHSAPASTQNSSSAATATSGLNIFGVRAVDRTMITQQGIVSPTANWSDIGINGRGFFMVTQPDASGAPQSTVSPTDGQNMLYTRAGQFQQHSIHTGTTATTATSSSNPSQSPGADDKAYFVTSGGQYLMGWKADPQGRIAGVTTTASSSVPTSSSSSAGGSKTLVPVYTQLNATITGVATTAMQAVMNLPDNATMTASTQSFTDTTAAVDPGATAQSLDMRWSRSATDGDTWTVDCSLPTVTAPGWQGSFATASTPLTVKLDANGAIASIKDSTGAAVPTAASGKPILNINWDAVPAAMPVAPATAGTATVDFNAQKPTLQEIPLTLTVYDNNYKPQNLPATFEHAGNGQWYMRLKPSASVASITALSATGGTTTTTTASSVPGSIPITFDGTGAVQSPTTVNFSIQWVEPTPAVTPARGTNTVALDMSKISQFTGDSPTKISVKVLDQDGYESGIMDSANFSSTGELIGHFSNGRTRTLFMVPVATFTAADQLDSVSGTVFRRTQQAGDLTVDTIGAQGSGAQMVAQAIETSNVDLASEFTRMIITQKAYSMNATVFKTADEMTTSARDLLT
ncbi:Flagellar hook protein FlgE [Candidatus Terasakiella magnetica]|nr:Flagellar hook protein FlgE [Candidatus Terasakiella magnetica]